MRFCPSEFLFEPIFTPTIPENFLDLKFLTMQSKPLLLNPSLLINAFSKGKRKIRGFGLPSWGKGVTVPTSMNPKPNEPSESM